MGKLDLKGRVEDGHLDLGLSQLEEVPLKEMVPIKHKIRKLDLSNNQLTSLQPTFANQLVLLTELDLSKNRLTEVPENFGLLVNLVHLDLYSNKIERLPMSFKDLTRLRWLDLKDNPLTPQLNKIAGPCVDQADCQKCAREIVLVMQEISRSIEEKKQQKTKEREQVEHKEKKKRKKNKDRGSTTNSSPSTANISAPPTTGRSMSEEILKTRSQVPVKHSKCPAVFPVRLLCYILRGLMWSLLLVGLLVASLYIGRLPQLRPIVNMVNNKLQIVNDVVSPYLQGLPVWLTAYSNKVIAWMQTDLPVYVCKAQDYLIDVFERTKVWFATKKD